MDQDSFFAPLEVKLAGTAGEGTFSGYASAFGNTDSHGDVVLPGAFAESLAERKAQGRRVPMHLMHQFLAGDGLPVGVWNRIEEDSRGLKVEGKISGMNTDQGRRIFELVKDGALSGLSIGYRVKPNGAVYGKTPQEPKRTLTKLDLREISLVDEPSNSLARVTEVKFTNRADLENLLLQAGVSRGAARKVATAGWKALTGENQGGGYDVAWALHDLSEYFGSAAKVSPITQAILDELSAPKPAPRSLNSRRFR